MRRAGIAVLLALVLAGCGIRGGKAVEAGLPGRDYTATREALRPTGESLLVRLNHDRDVLGLPVFTPSQALNEVAGLRVEDMAIRGYVGSIGPGDASEAAQDLMGAAGYRGRLGELIYEYAGAPGALVDSTVTTWLASEAHRALLLDPAYAFVGVGLIGDGGRWIIVLELAEQGP